MNPHKERVAQCLAKDRARERRKRAIRDSFVASWSERPILCRLNIHRPVVWALTSSSLSYMPHCGTCGYEWYGYL